MHTRAALAVLGLALLATGCSQFQDPGIDVAPPRQGEQATDATVLHFDLELDNPNGEAIELLTFDYALSLDGRRVYQGRRAAETTLGAGFSKRLSLPAVVRYDDVALAPGVPAAPMRYRLSGTLLYVTPGEIAEILLDTGVRRPQVAFDAAGTVSLSR